MAGGGTQAGQGLNPEQVLARANHQLGQLHYECNRLGEVEACLRQAEAANELYGSALVLALELELHLLLARGDTVDAMAALHRLDRLSASVHRNDPLVKQTFEGMAMRSRLVLAVHFFQSSLTQPNESQAKVQSTRLLAEVVVWLRSRTLDGVALSQSLRGHDVLARCLLARNKPVEAATLLDCLIGAAEAEDRRDDLSSSCWFRLWSCTA